MLRKVRVTYGPGGDKATSGNGTIIHGAGCIVYHSAVETTGSAAAQINIFDGNASNGELIFNYTLLANQSTSEGNPIHTWQFERGLYLSTVSGSVQGTMIVWLDHVCGRWLLAAHYAAELEAAAALSELGYGKEA